MTEEQIMTSIGGARRPVDFTDEFARLNLDAAARLLGAARPTQPEGADWWIAPPELQSKQTI